MIGTNGTISAITSSKTREVGNMPITITRALKIWMPTATGSMFPVTTGAGLLTSTPDGFLTTMADGSGSLIGDGPGSRMSPGPGALSLRPLVFLWQFLVLVAGPGVSSLSSHLGASLCFLLWLRIRRRVPFRPQLWLWIDRLPVGPCDPFYRWWGYRGGFNVVNITNVRNVTNITNIRNVGYMAPLAGRGRPVYSNLQAAMVNARVRRAIVTVPSQQFAAGNVLHVRRTTVTEAQFRQAQFVAGHVPVVPTRSSLRPTTRTVSRGAIPSSAVSNRRFFTTQQPPAGPRPFNEQVASVQKMIQNNRPGAIDARSMTNGRTDPASRFQSNNAPRASSSSGNQQVTQQGWRRLGAGSSNTSQPASQRQAGNSFQRNGNRPAFSNDQQARQGWRTFGDSPSGRVSSNPSVRQGALPNSGTRIYQDNRGVFRNAPAESGRAGWRSFSSSQNAGSGNRPEYRTRSFTPANQGMRTFPQNSFRSSPGDSPTHGARSGWQTFRPQPRQSFERSGTGFSTSRPQSGNRGWQSPSRSSGWGWASRGSYQKPPLEINKPIVNERSSGYGSYRGYSSRSYSRPSSGGFSRSTGGGGYHGGGGFHGASSGGHGRR